MGLHMSWLRSIGVLNGLLLFPRDPSSGLARVLDLVLLLLGGMLALWLADTAGD